MSMSNVILEILVSQGPKDDLENSFATDDSA
jgi:hypothetical protein